MSRSDIAKKYRPFIASTLPETRHRLLNQLRDEVKTKGILSVLPSILRIDLQVNKLPPNTVLPSVDGEYSIPYDETQEAICMGVRWVGADELFPYVDLQFGTVFGRTAQAIASLGAEFLITIPHQVKGEKGTGVAGVLFTPMEEGIFILQTNYITDELSAWTLSKEALLAGKELPVYVGDTHPIVEHLRKTLEGYKKLESLTKYVEDPWLSNQVSTKAVLGENLSTLRARATNAIDGIGVLVKDETPTVVN